MYHRRRMPAYCGAIPSGRARSWVSGLGIDVQPAARMVNLAFALRRYGAPMNQPGATLPTLTEKLLAIKEGHIGWIIFNNPEKQNAVSMEMWQSVPMAIDAFTRDPA